MEPYNPSTLASSTIGSVLTRRQVLERLALLAGISGMGTLAAACGSSTGAPSLAAPPPAVPPTPPIAPILATQPTPAAATSTINVVAKEFVFELDRLSVPSGKVHFTFKNAGTMTHDFWIFPPQDLSIYLAKKRAGEKVKGVDYLKDATELFDLEAGKSGEEDITLKPGLYTVACFVQGKNPDGSTFVHFDKGQHLTLEVTGRGDASKMASPKKTMNVVAQEWSFEPDTLLVAAGDVTFTFKNSGTMEHDFWAFPIQDRSEYLKRKLAGESVKGRDFLKGAEELFELDAGKFETKSMKLSPGTWGAACFILSRNSDGSAFIHSDKGQLFTFTVK